MERQRGRIRRREWLGILTFLNPPTTLSPHAVTITSARTHYTTGSSSLYAQAAAEFSVHVLGYISVGWA